MRNANAIRRWGDETKMNKAREKAIDEYLESILDDESCDDAFGKGYDAGSRDTIAEFVDELLSRLRVEGGSWVTNSKVAEIVAEVEREMEAERK